VSEEILINVTPQETRVAVIENGVLHEVHVERQRSRGLVGNIYKGRVVRVLPGMQAAFVDVGLQRTAFLHASDVYRPDTGPDADTPPISSLVQDGQDLVVQVAKDPIGTKGARITTQITLPARNLVFLPFSSRIGVSQRIENDSDREQLKALVRSAMGEEGEGGYIIRTAAESVKEAELQADIRYLRRTWMAIRERLESDSAPCLIHEDLPLALRVLRDLVMDNVEKVRIDSREMYNRACAFTRDLIPEVEQRMEYYPGERPIFDLYSVEEEIQKSMQRKVPLKSGGYLIFDQTEAMTTVDVNTGGFVGRRTLEETLFKTNLESAQAIARQLRLRNIGGIIIIDFIDMDDEEHKRQVLRALEKALSRDRVRSYVTAMSPLGLVEVTRKRTRESLEQMLCEPCPVCEGRGVMKTAQTVCYEMFREVLSEAREFGGKEYLLIASQVVIDLLLDEESKSLGGLQEFIGKPIHLQVDSQYHQEMYDVVLM
jgi:ribonuclease G